MAQTDEETYRFLIVGKVGSGKSSTGNTILGEQMFPTGLSFSSVTSDCVRKVVCRDGRKFEVIDCPGLFDTQRTNEEIGFTIMKAVAGMLPGPNAILYVMSLNTRYSAEEFGTYQRLKSLLGERITKHMIVLFTGGDALEKRNVSVDQHFSQLLPRELQKVLAECNNRRIVFNNEASHAQPQVERLLCEVRQMMTDNEGQPYTCPRCAAVEQSMEEEVARRMKKAEKEDLQRMAYVKQLEKAAEEAEEKFRRAQEQAEKNEQERKRLIQEEEREQRLARDNEESLLAEKNMLAFQRKMEEERRQDKEEMKKAAEEKEKALEKKRKEEMKAAKERQRKHDEEMENLKKELVEMKRGRFFAIFGKVTLGVCVLGITAGIAGLGIATFVSAYPEFAGIVSVNPELFASLTSGAVAVLRQRLHTL